MKISKSLNTGLIVILVVIISCFCFKKAMARYTYGNFWDNYYGTSNTIFPFNSYNPIYSWGNINTPYTWYNAYTPYSWYNAYTPNATWYSLYNPGWGSWYGSLNSWSVFPFNNYPFTFSPPADKPSSNSCSSGSCSCTDDGPAAITDLGYSLTAKERTFLSSVQSQIINHIYLGSDEPLLLNFSKAQLDIVASLPEGIFDHWGDIVIPRPCCFTYVGFVYTCSPYTSTPLSTWCFSPEALSSENVEAYVRLSNSSGRIIANDIEIDLTGRFKRTKCLLGNSCLCTYLDLKVEVYQKTDDGDHILYTGTHHFSNNIAVNIYIDRDEVEIIHRPQEPEEEAGDYFSLERIGNIPVEAVYRPGEITGEFGPGVPVPDAFIGYANSEDKPGLVTGDADVKVKDCAFGGTLHFYANIGKGFGQDGGEDMSEVDVKYFRMKYSYYNPETAETLDDTYISVPFRNTRKADEGTTTEYMGAFWNHPETGDPLPNPFYVYANPYEIDPNRNWKYRGLLMVLNTYTLPYRYGRYTFTVEPLDADMNPVTVVTVEEDPDSHCILTLPLLIDNDLARLTGGIENIKKSDGTGTSVCGLINLTGSGAGVLVPLLVEYAVSEPHGNLYSLSLSARFGQDCAVTGFAHTGLTSYTRSGITPYWPGSGGLPELAGEASKSHAWEKCAYEFRLAVRRRVTNGLAGIRDTHWNWKEFTYHVTIDSDNRYLGSCPR